MLVIHDSKSHFLSDKNSGNLASDKGHSIFLTVTKDAGPPLGGPYILLCAEKSL